MAGEHNNTGQKRPRRYKVERAKVVKPAERRSYTEFMHDEFNQLGFIKPTCRSECSGVPRPCPFVTCRYNLFLDVTERGEIRYNYAGTEPGEMDPKASCALDVVDSFDYSKGPLPQERLAELVGCSRDTVTSVIQKALATLQETTAADEEETFDGFLDSVLMTEFDT